MSYKYVWQLFSQKGKALSCQNRLPLGAEKELISTISQGVLGSEPRERTRSGSLPGLVDWSQPPVQRPFGWPPCSSSGQAALRWPQPMSRTAQPWSFWKDTGYTFIKWCHVKVTYQVHNFSVGNAKKHSWNCTELHNNNDDKNHLWNYFVKNTQRGIFKNKAAV